jgi:hypothetical protein
MSSPKKGLFIYRFAEQYKGERPIASLSLQEARVSGAAALIQGLVGYLPKEVREQIEYAKEFFVHDVSKPTDARLLISARARSL